MIIMVPVYIQTIPKIVCHYKYAKAVDTAEPNVPLPQTCKHRHNLLKKTYTIYSEVDCGETNRMENHRTEMEKFKPYAISTINCAEL